MQGVIAVLIPVVVFIVFALIFVYASRVKKVGPNQVLVISGRGEGHKDRDLQGIESKFRIVTGGRGCRAVVDVEPGQRQDDRGGR